MSFRYDIPPPSTFTLKQRYQPTRTQKARLKPFGDLVQCSEWHFQIKRDDKVVADWWPHKAIFRLAGVDETMRGNWRYLVKALKEAVQ